MDGLSAHQHGSAGETGPGAAGVSAAVSAAAAAAMLFAHHHNNNPSVQLMTTHQHGHQPRVREGGPPGGFLIRLRSNGGSWLGAHQREGWQRLRDSSSRRTQNKHKQLGHSNPPFFFLFFFIFSLFFLFLFFSFPET